MKNTNRNDQRSAFFSNKRARGKQRAAQNERDMKRAAQRSAREKGRTAE